MVVGVHEVHFEKLDEKNLTNKFFLVFQVRILTARKRLCKESGATQTSHKKSLLNYLIFLKKHLKESIPAASLESVFKSLKILIGQFISCTKARPADFFR